MMKPYWLVLILLLLAGCAQTVEFSSCGSGNICTDPAGARAIISENFGIQPQIACLECDMGRNGYVKAEGMLDNASVILHYSWQGDAWDACLRTESDEEFIDVKKTLCPKLTSEQTCGGQPYNTSSEVQQRCLQGYYDQIQRTSNTISVQQVVSECKSSIQIGGFDCT